MLSYPDKAYPELTEDSWDDLEQISQFSKAAILEWINLPEIDPEPVSIVHFFVFPERFKAVLPEMYQMYCEIFQQDPVGQV